MQETEMDWQSVLSSEAEEAEKNEELLERLYKFFFKNELPQKGKKPKSLGNRLCYVIDTAVLPSPLLSDSPDFRLLEDNSSLLKLASLLRSVMRVKGVEVQAAEEELSDLQERLDSTTANVGTSERDLLDKVSGRRGRESVCVCMCKRERESVCVCMCKRERERERREGEVEKEDMREGVYYVDQLSLISSPLLIRSPTMCVCNFTAYSPNSFHTC